MCDRTLKTDDGMVIQLVEHAMIARLQLTRVDLINPSFSRFMSPKSSVTEDRVHQSFHPLVHHVSQKNKKAATGSTRHTHIPYCWLYILFYHHFRELKPNFA
jgi:hypothetical protein